MTLTEEADVPRVTLVIGERLEFDLDGHMLVCAACSGGDEPCAIGEGLYALQEALGASAHPDPPRD